MAPALERAQRPRPLTGGGGRRVEVLLAPRVSAAVKALVANGTVGKLQRRWLSTDLTKLPVLG